uniref:Uncharacterized protein n=1 Tax=Anopheles quadriannulatus TaxID=34691 RepID=A0A182XQD8_ANOQN
MASHRERMWADLLPPPEFNERQKPMGGSGRSRRCRLVLCLEERYKLFKSVSSASTKRCDLLTQ